MQSFKILLVFCTITILCGCQYLPIRPHREENFKSDNAEQEKISLQDSLQSLLRKALDAKEANDTILEENLLMELLSKSKNRSKLEYWAANYHLGRLEYKRKQYRKAVTYYSIANSTDPTYIEVYHRANAYYALGIMDSAIRDYNYSIEFVKQKFVYYHPHSSIGKCDTCGFPFGSKEYDLLTDDNGETIKQGLDRIVPGNNVEVEEIHEK